MAETSSSRRPPSDASRDDGHPTSTDLGAAQPGSVRIVSCHGDGSTESTDLADLPGLLAAPDHRLWIDLSEPDADQIETAAKALGLHPLISEDILERNQRSKIESFDNDVLHIVLFALHYSGEAALAEVDFVLGNGYLLTVHDGSLGPSAAAPLRFGVEHALDKGPDYLFYAIADTIVDGYFPVLDKLGDDIDHLQDSVIEGASDWTLQRLFALKRELVDLRRATSPAREIFNQVTNREVGVIDPTHVVYFRDVYDHLIRVTDELDNYRDLVSGTLDIYVSIVNNDLSRIMKRLTGVTVVLAGIGAVAGVFGMSEAGAAFGGAEALGFWIVTVTIVVGAIGAAALLRRFDWI
ncbi:MAG TPA: magnesium transporter CorA family protein [Methylomirabilota bacterium]|nr:magnesium transporter CorA family protein [Methylomirabilota bacterium]